MSRIYLASSWRNPYQPEVLTLLRGWGHAVYDFRADSRNSEGPPHTQNDKQPGATAFKWSDLDPAWQNWTPEAYRHVIQNSPRAAQGYVSDLRGMEWADTCVLCLPCGNSAHIEAGYMKGLGKRLIIYWHNDERVTTSKNKETGEVKEWKFEPDLMYLLADNFVVGSEELRACLRHGAHCD